MKNKMCLLDIPPLPLSAQIPENVGADASSWLDDYVSFSQQWAPRAFADFHEACGIWVLSTIAARRLLVHFGGHRYTNLYIALVSRTSFHTKTTVAGVALQTIQQAGLSWLLAGDDSTPQKFISDLANREIPNYEKLDEDGRIRAKLRAATAGQRGWYYEEFGEKIRSMMQPGGFMSDFRGILRRFDDTPERYEYGTISRGSDIIERPYLALLANMTPDDIRPYARRGSSLWGDGFFARIALITPPEGNHSRGRFPKGERVIPSNLLIPLFTWHDRLGEPVADVFESPKNEETKKQSNRVIIKEPRQLVLEIDPDVIEAFYAYHDGLLEIVQANDNHDLDGNYARFAEKALRVSMLLASVSGFKKITFSHWARAQAITERWRAGLHRAYQQTNEGNASPTRENEDRVLSVISHLKNPTKREIRNYTKFSNQEIDKALNGLLSAGLIKETKTIRTVRFSRQSEESEDMEK